MLRSWVARVVAEVSVPMAYGVVSKVLKTSYRWYLITVYSVYQSGKNLRAIETSFE